MQNAFYQYLVNFKVALAFSLLLVFVILFSSFSNIFISSGSFFLEYSTGELGAALIAEIAALVIFMAFYSFFISLISFSVKRNLSKVKMHFYISEMMQKFTVKIFLFNIILLAVLLLLASALVYLNVPLLAIALLLLLVSLLFLFVPQSIVIDECSLENAVLNNLEFIRNYKMSLALVVVVGAAMVAVNLLIEFALDLFIYPVGAYVSLLFVAIFILPFIETLKTYMYMFKYELVKSPELMKGQHAPF